MRERWAIGGARGVAGFEGFDLLRCNDGLDLLMSVLMDFLNFFVLLLRRE
jgi:hypothetical protein